MLEVLGAIDGGPGARTEFTFDSVAVGQCGSPVFEAVGHGVVFRAAREPKAPAPTADVAATLYEYVAASLPADLAPNAKAALPAAGKMLTEVVQSYRDRVADAVRVRHERSIRTMIALLRRQRGAATILAESLEGLVARAGRDGEPSLPDLPAAIEKIAPRGTRIVAPDGTELRSSQLHGSSGRNVSSSKDTKKRRKKRTKKRR